MIHYRLYTTVHASNDMIILLTVRLCFVLVQTGKFCAWHYALCWAIQLFMLICE